MKFLQEEADKERERRLLKEKGRYALPGCIYSHITKQICMRIFHFLCLTEQEKKREAKQREREAREREAQKKKKAEEKEKKRKEYEAQMAAQAVQEQQKKKKEEKKKRASQNQGGLTHRMCEKVESVR